MPTGEGDREGIAGGMTEHALREVVLAEVHARPFQIFTAPRIVLHYAFMSDPGAGEDQFQRLAAECRRLGVAPPGAGARFCVLPVGSGTLRWESHTEFTTYSWDAPGPGPDAAVPPDNPFGAGFLQPGPMMVAARLDLIAGSGSFDPFLAIFDPRSLAASSLVGGRAVVASDFRVDRLGMTRILVVDRGLTENQAGPTVQRLIEVETYRTLAMLGLPEAQRIAPAIQATETALAAITSRIRTSSGLDANRELLDDLTGLAGDLESGVATSSYRFAASRAYADIVRSRLRAVEEGSVEGLSNWSAFLDRRMAPALRTCQALWERQKDLADRLARAAELLRTRVEIELEEQNRVLLQSMNRRARMQLRLQQTVEGLSVAAVSYYVVGLIGYLSEATGLFGVHVEKGWVAAAAVIPVVLAVWWLVRGVHARYADLGAAEKD